MQELAAAAGLAELQWEVGAAVELCPWMADALEFVEHLLQRTAEGGQTFIKPSVAKKQKLWAFVATNTGAVPCIPCCASVSTRLE